MKPIKIKTTEKTETTVERLTATTPEAAKMLGVSERTIHQLAKSGQLRCKRIGRRVLFSILEIKRFLDEEDSFVANEVPNEK